MSKNESIRRDHDKERELNSDSSDSSQTTALGEAKPRRMQRLFLVALVLGGILVVGWLVRNQRRSADETNARDALRQLGALVVMDADRKHVHSVNLSLPAVDERFEEAMQLLPKLHDLEVLTLSGTAVTDKQLKYVAHCSRLTSLLLRRTGIGDAALDHITGLHDLVTLYLDRTNITADSLDRIGRLTNLAILDLSETKIDGDLAGLSSLNNLQHLLLNRVDLSDEAMETLGRLKRLRRLTIVDSHVSDQAINKLEQARPDIRVDR